MRARRLSFAQHLMLMGVWLAIPMLGLGAVHTWYNLARPDPPLLATVAGGPSRHTSAGAPLLQPERRRWESAGLLISVPVLWGLLAVAVVAVCWLARRLSREVNFLVAGAKADGPDDFSSTSFSVREFDQINGALKMTASERWRDGERAEFLGQELQHRTNNLLAVVSSIARHTMVRGRPLAEARELFLGRLHALANANATLADAQWQGAELATVIAKEMSAFEGRYTASGPKVLLSAPLAQSASLLIHELVTNARRHGALSTESGRVAISWLLLEQPGSRRIEFEWIERGGPPARPPARRGFGRTLLETPLTECGPPTLVFGAEGFTYRTVLPLDSSLPDAA